VNGFSFSLEQNYAAEVNSLVALHELYKYINKYYDQVSTTRAVKYINKYYAQVSSSRAVKYINK